MDLSENRVLKNPMVYHYFSTSTKKIYIYIYTHTPLLGNTISMVYGLLKKRYLDGQIHSSAAQIGPALAVPGKLQSDALILTIKHEGFSCRFSIEFLGVIASANGSPMPQFLDDASYICIHAIVCKDEPA